MKIAHVGIIGFGIVGKSVLNFLQTYGLPQHEQTTLTFVVWDERELTQEEQILFSEQNISFVNGKIKTLESFIAHVDYVVASPGVDMSSYFAYQHKIICELDLFSYFFKKPTVAITGSLGKTTTTRLLASLIPDAAMGGNVGIGMLDLVFNQEQHSCAVLELSSFQLELSSHFAPDVAILTNIYPNHLNRHGSMERYIDAKWNLFAHQYKSQYALLPLEVIHQYPDLFLSKLSQLKSHVSFVSVGIPESAMLQYAELNGTTLFYTNKKRLYTAYICEGELVDEQELYNMSALPDITFEQNWAFIIATLYLFGINLKTIIQRLELITTSFANEHRLELVATINGVDFYNDSKATVIEATQAAVKKLLQNGRPQIVMLGGLNKGADRTPLIQFLKHTKNIKKVICFGTGCPDLISHFTSYPSLESALSDIMQMVSENDQVLFSPSGTSFDLFENYMKRGEAFKKLVLSYSKRDEGDEKCLKHERIR